MGEVPLKQCKLVNFVGAGTNTPWSTNSTVRFQLVWTLPCLLLYVFCTLATGPRGYVSLKLSDVGVLEPHVRARHGTAARFCRVVVWWFGRERTRDAAAAVTGQGLLGGRNIPFGASRRGAYLTQRVFNVV